MLSGITLHTQRVYRVIVQIGFELYTSIPFLVESYLLTIGFLVETAAKWLLCLLFYITFSITTIQVIHLCYSLFIAYHHGEAGEESFY